MSGMKQKVDVICQNCTDGRIIPIKIRMEDEDGIRQQYVIKSYREVPAFAAGYTMPNTVRISTDCSKKKFECRVNVFNRTQKINLIFNLTDLTWSMEA